jgi:hypothetical protein
MEILDANSPPAALFKKRRVTFLSKPYIHGKFPSLLVERVQG